jgi:hypothetical protein
MGFDLNPAARFGARAGRVRAHEMFGQLDNFLQPLALKSVTRIDGMSRRFGRAVRAKPGKEFAERGVVLLELGDVAGFAGTECS